MQDAARSPVGPNPVSTATKIRDVLIIVIAPFAVPGLILGLARGFALGDIAFGFVAVAIAGVARAVTLKTDEWQAYAIGAIIAICLQTTLAVEVDSVTEVNKLLRMTEGLETEASAEYLREMRNAAQEVVSAGPSLAQWISCLATGGALMVVSFELIRRER